MAITLTVQTQALIESRTEAGGFPSPDELVRAALDALAQRDPLAEVPTGDLETLYPGYRVKIAQGLAEADAGQLTDGEAFFAELERDEQAPEAGPHARQPT